MSPLIIDVHTHVFSEEVKRHPDRYAAACTWFAHLYPEGRPRRLAVVEDLVAELDESGIDRAVMCGFGWSSHELCVEANDYALGALRRYPGRLLAFAAIYPPAGERAVAEIERCARAGIAGIGEMMPDGQGFLFDSAQVMTPIVEAAMAYRLPILVHASEPLGHRYRGKGTTTPEVLYRFLRRFPQVRLICAHWGGGLPFYELMPKVREAAANVVYDTAASPLLYRPQILAAAIQLVGEEKVIFGSDFPLLRQSRVLEHLRQSGLSNEVMEKILGGNAARFLGLPKSEPEH
ncbi:MAG: amidohydrolase [Chloroflexi bacterium]|nr:amidohydrolase [Chloroflexota bacterium]